MYRIQDHAGRGPFKPGMSKRWADKEQAPGMQYLPTFFEEFPDIYTKFKDGFHHGSAVRDPHDLTRWFSPSERKKLAKLRYWPVCISVDHVLAESKNQLVFARRRALWRNVLVIDWAALDEAAA